MAEAAKLRPQEGRVSAAENAVIACIEYNDKKCTQRAGSSDSNDAPLQLHRIQINPPPPPPLSEELTLKPELAMLSIRTRRCALCLTLCDWEQQQPLRPSRAGLRVRMLSCRGRCTMLWNRLSRAIITCSRCTFLQSRAITTCSRCTFLQSRAITTCSSLLVQVSCNHNLQQVHFSAVSCNHNLQQVHSSCGGISTAFTSCTWEKCTICRKVHLLQV